MHLESTAAMRHLLRLVVGLAILCAGWTPALAQPQSPVQGWDVELLIDQSGSMFKSSDPCDIQPDATDSPKPEGLPLRQWAAYKFIDYLGIDPAGKDRIGITYFGETVEPRSALFSASDAISASSAKAALRENNCPPDLGWTNVNQALEAAYNKLTASSGDSQKVVVLLTDGRPELADPWPIEDGSVQGKRSYFQEHFQWIDKFKQAGIKLFIIALGENAQLEDPTLSDFGVLPVDARKYRDLWNHAAEQTGGEYFKVATSDKLWNTFHAIAARLARIQLGEQIEGVKGPETLRESFQVPEGSSRLVVTVDRNDATEVTLVDSNGTRVLPVRSEEFYDIYSVADPSPGRWSLEFVGPPTTYTVLIDYKVAGLNVDVVSLPQVYPSAKPLPMRVKVSDDDGNPLDDALVGATITGPGDYNAVVPMALVDNEPGVFAGTWEDTNRLGDFTVVFEANQGDTKRTKTPPRTVTLDNLLYLDVRRPSSGEYIQQAEAQIALLRGDQPVALPAAGATPPQLDVALQDSNGTTIATLPLSGLILQPDNTFVARFEDVPQGDYIFDVTLNVPDEGVTDRAVVPFRLTPEATPFPTSTPAPTYTPVPEDPVCKNKDLGTILLRPGETKPVPVAFDTTQLPRSVVVEAALETAADASVSLETRQFSLDQGIPDAQVGLILKASGDVELKPGLVNYPGTVTLNVQGRPAFCSLSFTAALLGQRVWLPEANLEGKPGDTWRMKVEYDTSGQQMPEQVQVRLDGLPPYLISIDAANSNVKMEADKRGTMIIPLEVSDDAAPQGDVMYKGQVVFIHEDGTQDVSEVSLSVVPPSALERLMPFLIILLLLAIGVAIFLILDPLCLRCKLSGKLVYVNVQYPDVDLGGRKQSVTLESPQKQDGSLGASAQLVLRARKKGPPVVDVRDAADLRINGQSYQRGDKGIVLRADSILEVGDAQIRYEGEFGAEEDLGGDTGYGDTYASDPFAVGQDSWSNDYGTGDYSTGGSATPMDYDRPATDTGSGSSTANPYSDLDYS